MLTMGLDPFSAALAPVAINWLTSFLAPPAAAPAAPGITPAQLQAMLKQEEAQRQADSRTRTAWLIGAGLLGAGVLTVVLVRARK